MPTCPLCEHVQTSGASCDVCGRTLAEAAPISGNVPMLAELEQTRWEEPFPEDGEPMPEFEATGRLTGVVPEAPPLPDIEATSLPTAAVPAPAPLGDLETGRAVDTDARVAPNMGAATCRYCKNVQQEGALCDRCGMRLDRLRPSPVSEATAAVDELGSRCRRCGEKVTLGTRCRGCGMSAPLEAAGA